MVRIRLALLVYQASSFYDKPSFGRAIRHFRKFTDTARSYVPLHRSPGDPFTKMVKYQYQHDEYNVWDAITYPFPYFNGCTVEIWEWISNFIPRFTELENIYSCIVIKVEAC